MPSDQRLRVPGATHFFTVNLAEAGGTTLTDRINLLRGAYRLTPKIRCDAMVIRLTTSTRSGRCRPRMPTSRADSRR